jgi:hypothetical protein
MGLSLLDWIALAVAAALVAGAGYLAKALAERIFRW